MSEQRLPIDARASGLMLLLCSIWALQQVLLKATAADFSPMLQTSMRCGLGAVLVGLFVWLKQPQGFRHSEPTLIPGLFAGFLFGSEFLLAAIAIEMTHVAHLIVMLYTAPIFAAIGLALFIPSERLDRLQWGGILLAFAGIVIAFGVSAEEQPDLPNMLLGDLLALAAGAIWGATTVVVRSSNLTRAPVSLTLIYQLLACFVMLLVFALVTDDTRFNGTPFVIGSLAFQVIVVSFFSYLTWFWLLKTYLASRLGVFSFLTPMLGVILSAWLLDEQISLRFLFGAALVVVGITLVSAHGYLASKFGARVHSAKQV